MHLTAVSGPELPEGEPVEGPLLPKCPGPEVSSRLIKRSPLVSQEPGAEVQTEAIATNKWLGSKSLYMSPPNLALSRSKAKSLHSREKHRGILGQVPS